MKLDRTIAWFGAASLMAASSFATEVRADDFNGCVYRGVEQGCLMVKSGRNIFNVTAAQPAPDIGRHLGISGAGIRSGKASSCSQGIALENIRWSYTRQRCPANNGRLAPRKK